MQPSISAEKQAKKKEKASDLRNRMMFNILNFLRIEKDDSEEALLAEEGLRKIGLRISRPAVFDGCYFPKIENAIKK